MSVVIPVYGQAEYLAQAIRSVLDQTYGDFEIVIVDDASLDNPQHVVDQFADSRIHYISHSKNRGLPAAKNSGIRASSGELIALLDADDYYHPDKLSEHVEFAMGNQDIGVSYNSRFELNYSSETIRGLGRPPQSVSLEDFVLGYPFAPSDMVISRAWASQVNLFDESYRHGGEDQDFLCRLALTGCQFGRVDRSLNYRRHHSARFRLDLKERLEDALRALESTFADSRCPRDILGLRVRAYVNHYLVLIYHAFAQGKSSVGQKLLREAARIKPDIVDGNPSELVRFLAANSIADESVDHEENIAFLFDQFPPEMAHLSDQLDWAVARGYVLKGTRAFMWGWAEAGKSYFARAVEMKANIGKPFLAKLAHQLMDYESEFGRTAAQDRLQDLGPHLQLLGGHSSVRWLKALCSANQAFESYRKGEYNEIPGKVARAVADNPKHLADRGVLLILARSVITRSIKSDG